MEVEYNLDCKENHCTGNSFLDNILLAYKHSIHDYFEQLKNYVPLVYGLPPLTQKYILNMESIDYDEDITYNINLRLTEESYTNMKLSNMISAKSVQNELNNRIQNIFTYTSEHIKLISSKLIVKQKYIDILYRIEYISKKETSQSLIDFVPEDTILYHMLPEMDACELYSFATTDKKMLSFVSSLPYYRDKIRTFGTIYNFITDGILTDDDQINRWLQKLTTKKRGIHKVKTLSITNVNTKQIIIIMKKLSGLQKMGSSVRYSEEYSPSYNKLQDDVDIIMYNTLLILQNMFSDKNIMYAYTYEKTLDDYIEAKKKSSINGTVPPVKPERPVHGRDMIKIFEGLMEDANKFTCAALSYMIQYAENNIYTNIILDLISDKLDMYAGVYINNLNIYSHDTKKILLSEEDADAYIDKYKGYLDDKGNVIGINIDIDQAIIVERNKRNKIKLRVSQDVLNYIQNTTIRSKKDLLNIVNKYKKDVDILNK
uniref:Uncharacterized protein n=1 Tax=Pithovirus LCPAC101 TaxID=2506586 RepID=A0A481Z364_9VIRU|nr:MAG: hypothetical protein LCPAC101_00840 [Pithovirus LCPAC101]